MSLIEQLKRPHLRTFKPYASARRTAKGPGQQGGLWLNANESPYGRNWQLATDNLNRYPEFQDLNLNAAYARYTGVEPDQVISHRGSDESIELLIRTFCEPGQDAILICPPTYGMYKVSADIQHVSTTQVPLLASGELDLPAVKEQLPACKLVFLCHPSNPLGNLLPETQLKAVLEAAGDQTLVVVDEAYIEYSGLEYSAAEWLAEYPNLVVMRTLSKAFGLAGIRVGFTLAQTATLQALLPVLAPYPLPTPCIEIARQALTADEQIQVRQNVIESRGERQRLAEALAEFAWVQEVFPSHTNFVLFRTPRARELLDYCLAHQVIIRDQSAQQGLHNCLRITVGSPAETDQLLTVLRLFSQEEI